MKKLIVLIVLSFIMTIGFSQIGADSTIKKEIAATNKVVQETVNTNLVSALSEIAGFINVTFIFVFIITAFVLNSFITADGLMDKINWMRKWKAGWIFVWGLLILLSFVYVFDCSGKVEIFSLFFSLAIALGFYKVVGLDKVMNFILQKFGFALPKQKTTEPTKTN